MATAESAEINIAEGIRKLCASGTTRFWVNQSSFAKAAGAADEPRDAKRAKSAKSAPENFMEAWNHHSFKYSGATTMQK